MKQAFLFISLLIIGFLFLKCSNDDDEIELIVDCNDSNLQIALEKTTSTTCNEFEGKIEVSGQGGVGALMFSLNGGPQRSSGQFEALPTGIYFIKVRDEEGCEAELEVTLASGISLSTDVFDRIGETCAVSGCHITGAQSPDFTLKSNILSASQNIKRRLEDNSMPPADSGVDPMRDEDKAIVICWVNDGAKDN